MDLLTVPLITLGIPLIIYISLEQKNRRVTWKETLSIVAIWLLGYASIWGTKWILGEVLGLGTITEAIKRITERTGIVDEKITILPTIVSNTNLIKSHIAMAIIIMVSLITMCKCRYKKLNLQGIENYIIIAVLPIIWYVCTKQHSFIHAKFTYRILAITILALFFSVIKMINDSAKKEKEISKCDNNYEEYQ